MTKNFLLIANGDFLSKEIILEAALNNVIVALDGAANFLEPLGIIPDIILGDFDSINYVDESSSRYIKLSDQNQTDLIKGIRYCDLQGAESITIVCATGGRIDHHEGAIRCLRSEYRANRPMRLHTSQQSLRFAKDESVTLMGNVGDKCGILAFPAGQFSSQGLEYDVCDHRLEFGFSDSICNALKTPTARISVIGEALIVMPPLLAAQRKK